MFKSPALKVLLDNVTTTKENLLGHEVEKHTCNFCGEPSYFDFKLHEAFKSNSFGFDSILGSACCDSMRNKLTEIRSEHVKEFLEYSIVLIDELSTPLKYRRFRMADLKGEQHKEAEVKIRASFKKGFSGKGFYIYSAKNGTGKTATATIICKTICAYLGFKKYEFVNYADFVSDYEQLPFEEKGGIIEKYKTCNVLLIDDLGKGRLTPSSISNIYSIVNNRSNNELITIFTSNMSVADIRKNFDSSVASRIFEMTEIIEMSGKDLRLN